MKYVNRQKIEDFYAAQINAKPRYVYLTMTPLSWRLHAIDRMDRTPKNSALVGRFTIEHRLDAFVGDVEETAREMVAQRNARMAA